MSLVLNAESTSVDKQHYIEMEEEFYAIESDLVLMARNLMNKLKESRPLERGERSRKYDTAITETEKLIAYLLTLDGGA